MSESLELSEKDKVAVSFTSGIGARPSQAFVQEHGRSAAMCVAMAVGTALVTAGKGIARTTQGVAQTAIGVVGMAVGGTGTLATSAVVSAAYALPTAWVGSAAACAVGAVGILGATAMRKIGLDSSAIQDASEYLSIYSGLAAVGSLIPTVMVMTMATDKKNDALQVKEVSANLVNWSTRSALDGLLKVPAGLAAAVGVADMEIARHPLNAVRSAMGYPDQAISIAGPR